MDFLKQEIERKRKQIEQVTASSSSSSSKDTPTNEPPKKKYIRRGDLEKLREQQYLEEQAKRELEKRKKLDEKLAEINGGNSNSSSSTNEDGSLRMNGDEKKGSSKSNNNNNEEEDDESWFNVSNEEVIQRLRARDQPIRLFGESDKQRIKRLHVVEMEERTDGQRNEFRNILEATHKNQALEDLKKKGEVLPNDEDERNKVDPYEGIDTSELSLDLLRTDPERTKLLIAVYLKRLLKVWEKELAGRDEDLRRSMQGKLATTTQRQAVEYLKPFFKQLKRNQLPMDVLTRITEICQEMQKREYVNANDAYLRLSIGNSPWPIGVTMVGIHERSAREKISASQVAHVLNDEASRKWIQSLKRVMTFCQTKYPPSDLAKMVG